MTEPAIIGSRRARRAAVLLLGAAACVNLAAAVALVLRDPHRASDLLVMRDWCRDWLVGGRSLYIGPEASADYPPNAIVLLAPLALLPARSIVALWTASALVAAPLLSWLVMRCAAGRRRTVLAVAAPALLSLCWAAPRTLLQFSVLSLTLAIAALVIVDERRGAAGIALGFALFKPHIAGPVALWMAVTGRVRPLTTAIAVAAAGWAVYDARIGESPLTTAWGWWHVVGEEYSGRDGLVGHTSLRAWALQASASAATADAIWIAASVLLLAVVCWLARRDRTRSLDAGGLAVPAMFCLWSLLVTYHNGNNMILMLPAFGFLWFHDEGFTWAHWTRIAVLQAALSFDVPVRLADTARHVNWARIPIEQFDRLLVLGTLAYVSASWYRLTAGRSD